MRKETEIRRLVAVAKDGMPFDIACVSFLTIDVRQISEIYKLTSEEQEKILVDMDGNRRTRKSIDADLNDPMRGSGIKQKVTSNLDALCFTNRPKDQDVKERLGLVLMTERKKAGLTQQQCASKFEVPEAAWGNSERGRNTSVGRILEMIGMINMAALPKAMEIVDVNKTP